MRIDRYFDDFFDDKHYSLNELLKYSNDHHSKMKKNNPGGVFDSLLADTGVHISTVEAISKLLESNLASRQDETIDVNEVLIKFKKEASHVENLIAYTLNRKSGDYQNFYPHGVTEYTNMNLENAKYKMTRFVGAFDKFPGKFPESVVKKFQKLLSNFKKEIGEQSDEKADISGNREKLSKARKALQLQLTKNIHVIAAEFPGDKEKAAVYTNQSLLNDVDDSSYELLSGSLDGSSIDQIEYDSDLIKNDTLLTFSNESNNTTLEFYFSVKAGDQPGANKIMVNPDSVEVVQASEIGFDSDNHILQVKNLDAFASDYEVQVPE